MNKPNKKDYTSPDFVGRHQIHHRYKALSEAQEKYILYIETQLEALKDIIQK